MLNIFEQPWTLLTAAVFALLVVLTIRQMFPEKACWWQLAIPLGLAIAAFGLDHFIETDFEKINNLTETSLKAVENEDLNTINNIVLHNYSDSYHKTKESLMAHCAILLSRTKISTVKKLNQKMQIDRGTESHIPDSQPARTAIVQFKVAILFDQPPPGLMELTGRNILTAEAKLYLVKDRSANWLINRAEILKINEQTSKWGHINR